MKFLLLVVVGERNRRKHWEATRIELFKISLSVFRGFEEIAACWGGGSEEGNGENEEIVKGIDVKMIFDEFSKWFKLKIFE